MHTQSHSTFTPHALLAALSVLVLIGVISVRGYEMFHAKTAAATYVAPSPTQEPSAGGASWQQEMMLLGLATSSEPGVNDGTDPIGMIGPQVIAQLIGAYQGLKESGTYSSTTAASAAELIAPNVRANVVFQPYGVTDIKTDPDASYQRMLTYRADMQVALKPLLDNKTAEVALYGSYVATGDQNYLRELETAANNYEIAAQAASALTVPADIAQTHVEVVNVLVQMSAIFRELKKHADDPLASVAILRSYNDTEAHMVSTFDKLAQYQRMKQP